MSEIYNYDKYKNHICKLKDFDTRLKDMGIPPLNDDMVLWVYLQSFPDDDILTGSYIYNFGIMNEEMKGHIGQVIDYGCYQQTIVKMSFSEFKNLYNEQTKERDILYLQYPGLVMNVNNPNYFKTEKENKKCEKKKCDDPEQIKLREEKLKKYRHEYYEKVTKKKRQEQRKNDNGDMI